MAMDYRRLNVWQKSMMLVKNVYPLIERLPPEEKYALGNQIRRAVTSIVLNIAEGTGRNSDKELRYFLTIARGSATEVEAQLFICIELGFFPKEDAISALQLCDELKGMLYRFIQRVEANQRNGKQKTVLDEIDLYGDL